MAWERVYTINEFWDSPRLGVADVDGVPHIYQAPFDPSIEDYSPYCLVARIDRDLMALVLEDWALWTEWQEAYQRGEVPIETHPVLPDKRTRHEQLRTRMGERLRVDQNHARRLWPRFRRSPSRPGELEVDWSAEP